MPPAFVPGLELAGDFYDSVVRPLLDDEFPGLRYAAAVNRRARRGITSGSPDSAAG